MSPRRRLLRAFSVLALAAALVFWWSDRRPAPAPVYAPPREGPPTASSPPRLDPTPTAAQGVRVVLQVVDVDGTPLAGVQVSLNGARGTSDAQGQVTLSGVQQGVAVTEVEPPWLVVDRSARGPVLPPSQQRLLVLERACPGMLVVQDEQDGTVIEGARVVSWSAERTRSGRLSIPLLSDDLGQVFLAQRPCGAARFSLKMADRTEHDDLGAYVRAGEPAVLVVPMLRQGGLQVLGPDGEPLAARLLDDPAIVHMEDDGVGRFWLQARRAVLPVLAEVDGLPTQYIEVPLSGGVTRYQATEPHMVDVQLRCEACPVTLRCGGVPCTRTDATAFSCPCPTVNTDLTESAPPSPVLGTAPIDETAMVLDLRAGASLRGQWTGALPCVAEVRHGLTESDVVHVDCDQEGGFLFAGLRAGEVTVRVSGRGEQAAHALHLQSGDQIDMGRIWPDSMHTTGRIDADFPLLGAALISYPHSTVELEPSSGWFSLRGLPADTPNIRLQLVSASYGTFEESFAISATSELMWALSWHPPESEPQDSGLFEAGLFEADTGSSAPWEGPDTGWTDVRDSGLDSGR